MPLVRTTMQPHTVITVTALELADLQLQGVVYDDYEDLYVNFFTFEGGTPTDLAAYPAVEVVGPAPSTSAVVAETTVGVTRAGVGAYRYRWREEGQLAPASGTYTVTWTGIDVVGATVTATEEVVVP